MLFNSTPFIFIYLPIALVGYFALGRADGRLAVMWLGAASFAFYAYWDVSLAPILLASILFNFLAGRLVFDAVNAKRRGATLLFAAAIAGNLLALGYFKYAAFVTSNLALIPGLHVEIVRTVLPLGMSFFTFTQIAYLADIHNRKAPAYSLCRYFMFVTYFPHLIAGPIIHHANIMPQLERRRTYRPQARNLAMGLTIFIFGLVKKAVIADSLAPVANLVFGRAADGQSPEFAIAWMGAMAYTTQLYFDFSGYSDMAVGLSLMFNIVLPINFFSPYKALSIIDFWRRWHISLSSFLRDYVYIPLGGRNRRLLNVLLTMLIGGLWHGAGWTFIVWGALHGLYLVVNHLFRAVRKAPVAASFIQRAATGLLSGGLTFACVVVGWVVFRSDSLATALAMLKGMAGQCRGETCFGASILGERALQPRTVWLELALALAAVWLLPNVYQVMSRYRPFRSFEGEALPPLMRYVRWRPQAWIWPTAVGVGGALAILAIAANPVSEFLYFQF